MKTTVRLPIHFTARPRRAKSLQPVVTSYSGEYEIPEIGDTEAETVFETKHTYDDDDALQQRVYRVLEHQGRIYRRVSDAGRYGAILDKPFSGSWWQAECSWDGISRRTSDIGSNPLTRNLQKDISWKLMGAEKGDMRPKAYPPNYPNTPGQMWDHTDLRDRTDLMKVIADLTEIDSGMIEAQVSTFQHVVGKLLLIEGRLWMETPPPSFVVCHDNERTVSIQVAHLHDTPMPQFGAVCFPLSRRQDAEDYARGLAVFAGNDGGEDEVQNYVTDFVSSDSETLWFDQEEIETRNLGLNLTMATMTILRTGRAAWMDGVRNGEYRENHLAAVEMLGRADFATGRYEDMSPVIEGVTAIWDQCRRPWKHMAFCGFSPEAVAYILRRPEDHLENAPISLDLRSPHSPR